MKDFAVLFGLIASLLLLAVNANIGPGVWRVLHMKAIQDDNYLLKMNISQHKYNRSHDVFDAYLTCIEPLDDTLGIRVDICTQVDGGCKPYQVLTDDSFISFVEKYAEKNVRDCLAKANIDPPELPIAEGMYHVENYMFDYNELPPRSPYGQYFAKACLLQGTKEVSCIETAVEFVEVHQDSDEER